MLAGDCMLCQVCSISRAVLACLLGRNAMCWHEMWPAVPGIPPLYQRSQTRLATAVPHRAQKLADTAYLTVSLTGSVRPIFAASAVARALYI